MCKVIPGRRTALLLAILWTLSSCSLFDGLFPKPKAATPTFSVAGGSYSIEQTVAIATGTAGAAIRFTTDGSVPSASSALYTEPLRVAASTTLKAVAMQADMDDSDASSATYTLVVASPTFNPAEGTYSSAQSVSISCGTPGATIRYTTNGIAPTAGSGTVYAAAVSIADTVTLRAIASRAGWTDSAVASAAYTISGTAVPAGSVRVAFHIDLGGIQASARSADGPQYSVYCVNLTDPNLATTRTALSDGDNHVDLPKEGTYQLSIVKQDSRGMTTEGTVSIASLALQTLPLADSTASLIDLGTLTKRENQYQSAMTETAAATGTGTTVQALQQLAVVDGTASKYVKNQDVNRNGTPDVDEGLKWLFGTTSDLSLGILDYDFDTGYFVSGYRLAFNNVTYKFQTSLHLDYPNLSPDRSVYGDIKLHHLGTPENIFTANWMSEQPGGQKTFFPTDSGLLSVLPYNGDYSVVFGSQASYYIDDVEFLRPERDFEGFCFPIVKITYDLGTRKYKTLQWKWKIVRNGGYVDAAPAEVKLTIKQMYFSFEKTAQPGVPYIASPGAYGCDYWNPGTISLPDSAWSALTFDNTAQRFVDFTDVGDNYYKFQFLGNVFAVSNGSVTSDLVGTWANAGYNGASHPAYFQFESDGTGIFKMSTLDQSGSPFTYSISQTPGQAGSGTPGKMALYSGIGNGFFLYAFDSVTGDLLAKAGPTEYPTDLSEPLWRFFRQ